MPHKKQKKHAETEVVAKAPEQTVRVLEHKADLARSKAKGTLLTLDELPEFLSAHMKELEETEHYKKHGTVWFYLDTVGTEMKGRYRFNQEAKSMEEMFKPVTNEEYENLPFNEKARFWSGDKPLSVLIYRDPDVRLRRLSVYGDDRPMGIAPVVVAKQPPIQTEPELKEAKRK